MDWTNLAPIPSAPFEILLIDVNSGAISAIFKYRWTLDTDIGYPVLKPFKVAVSDKGQQSNERPAWPEEHGEYIATSSETIPHFPETLSGFRPAEENKDFWNRPFPVQGLIRLFEGDDWQGIPKFPNTMNDCSDGFFMIRWRSSDPNVGVRSSVRYSSKSKAKEKTGIFGYMSGTNCEQPMFKFGDAVNEATLVDVYYELKFWQAAP